MKDRIYAFLIHLSISFSVAVLVSLVVFYVWYPAPLHEAVGVTNIFLMLMSIDIIVGPIITFLVYKRGKPSLKFDLSTIAVLQMVALSYGVYNVYEGRPAFVVFNVDMFQVTRLIDVDASSLETAKKANNPVAVIGWSPNWVSAVASKDPKRRQEIMFSSVQGGNDWPQLPELYVPLSETKDKLLEKSKPLQELQKIYENTKTKNAAIDAEIKTLLAKDPKGQTKWLPLQGGVKDMVVLLDGITAQVLKIVDITPWP
jgi:hypothetical protein